MITNADHDSQPPATGDTDDSLFRPDESVRHGMLQSNSLRCNCAQSVNPSALPIRQLEVTWEGANSSTRDFQGSISVAAMPSR